MTKDAMAAFRDAEALLRKYGFAEQADAVRDALAGVQADPVAGYRRIATDDWWGAADSIADLYLYKEGETFSVGQEQDNRALRAALATIHDAMRAAGVTVEWRK